MKAPVALLCLLSLASCGPAPTAATESTPRPFVPTYRSAPDEWGVVCYLAPDQYGDALSCVQVLPPRPAPHRQSVPLT